jgi:hypothetical protein
VGYLGNYPATGDEPLGRPFLASALAGPPLERHAPTPAAEGTIRPYVLTGGRTDTANLPIETIVVARGSGPVPVTGTHPSTLAHRAVLELCERPHSVAEVAAHLRLPLGVAQVLVADLLAAGRLHDSTAGLDMSRLTRDVSFIERLIAGVAAL